MSGMKRLLLAIPLLAASCGAFDGYWTPGEQRVLEYQITSDKGFVETAAAAPIAAGGHFYLSCRDSQERRLRARTGDATLLKILVNEGEPVREKKGWRTSFSLQALSAGRPRVEVRPGDSTVDSLALEIKPVDRFRWEVATDRLKNRRKGNDLELFIGDVIEIRIHCHDERGWTLYGIGAFEAAFDDAHPCVLKSEPPTNVLRFEAKNQGRATLVLRGVAGSAAELKIPVLVR